VSHSALPESTSDFLRSRSRFLVSEAAFAAAESHSRRQSPHSSRQSRHPTCQPPLSRRQGPRSGGHTPLSGCQEPDSAGRLALPNVRLRLRVSGSALRVSGSGFVNPGSARQVSRPASPVEEPARLGTDFAFSQHGLIPPRPARHRDGRTRFELGRMGLIPAGFTSDFPRTRSQHPLADPGSALPLSDRSPLSPDYRNHRQRPRQAQGGASPALVDCGTRGTLGLPHRPLKTKRQHDRA
jgi:hypothetical protein